MLKGKKKKKMDNQTLIMTLSITPTILIGVIGILFLKIRNLRKKLNELNKNLNNQKEKEESFLKFYVGSKALLNDYSLTHTDSSTGKKTNFTVDYEVEVVDISETEIKVKAISFVSNDSFSRDPNNQKSIYNFMQNKWISKKEAQLIMDESHNRHVKLEKLGI